jgi:hypothetical protein
MSSFWTVIGVGVGAGLLAYVIGTIVSTLFERFGAAMDAVSGEGSDVRRPEPPQTRHPHRPIY